MKTLRIMFAAATSVFTLSLAGSTLAQTQGGADFLSMGPQVLQYGLAHFQDMTPQQQQAAMGLFRNSSPQQQAAVIQQFMNLNPQQQQAAMEQFQKIDPEMITNLVQRRVNIPLRDQMAVTNDDEWALIELKIAAVTKAQTALMADGGGMVGMGSSGGNRGFQGSFRARSPEAQALQRALAADAPATQVRSLLDTYRAAHQEKQATLVKAQEDLRAVLAVRQEAVAVMWNLLD